MTDEEKKAYDNLIILSYFTMEKDKESIGIILNLIEKQQKEIEELKENLNETVTEIYIRCSKKFKDKIKAKIEEVEQWELYNMKIPKLSTLDERLGAKIGIKYVLQSLLEKE